MGIIYFVLIGILVGWTAGVVVKGHGLGGLADLIIGVAGASIGGYMFDILGFTSRGLLEEIATSVGGAIILLFIVGVFSGAPRFRNPIW
jgi:uncharacterized membrane protein YeaQ/YmgE (transglycosylase-associated protein family)